MEKFYKKCPDCGAHLDPGERCDCQDQIEHEAEDAAIREAISAHVKIVLNKESGSESYRRTIEASSTTAAMNGLAVLVREYAMLTNSPVTHVLAVLATLLTVPGYRRPAGRGEASA